MRVVVDMPSYVRCRKTCEANLSSNRCWNFYKSIKELPDDELFASGHRGCAGCGATIAMRLALKAAGRNTIVTQATGCMEVISTPYPETAWKTPWIHTAFENSAAVASGVEAALKALGRKEGVNVLAIGGDGGTVDIGFQALSGAIERGHDFTYLCYDNEAYMNTGVQRSGATPFGASTTTSPPGKISIGNDRPKKDMPRIIAAHGTPYVATASIAFPADFVGKMKRALATKGPSYVHVHSPCTPGWGIENEKTVEIARLAVDTGMWVLYEIRNGEGHITYKPPLQRPVKEYLRLQKRFRHLKDENIAEIQVAINERWKELFDSHPQPQ